MNNRSDLPSALLDADVGRLGFRPEDAAEFRRLAAGLPSRPELLARVETIHDRVRARIGDFDADDAAVEEVKDPTRPEDGLVSLLALVAAAEDVHADLVDRGVPGDVAWASLSDLGQQVHIHRVVHGSFGLSSQSWCAGNYTGRLLWLGRLQFALERDETNVTGSQDNYVLGVHIPESGPLTPEAIDESLALAREIALPAFSDYSPQVITLYSWLLDPGIIAHLDPASNMARFAHRFELSGESRDGYRDALYFGFHIEPGDRQIDLDSLPQNTSLQRAIVAQLKGEGVHLRAGRLIDSPGRSRH